MELMQATGDERSVLRWGGLAGVFGAALTLIAFVVVGVFVLPVADTPRDLVARFPEIRAARTVENGLYLAAVALWAVHVTALGQVARGHRSAAALFGRSLAMLGLIVLAAGALPHIATLPISDLYRAPGASADQRTSLVHLFQATDGIFEALLVTGLFVLSLGLIALGAAIRADPAFGARSGTLTIGLGVIGFASALAGLVGASEVVAIGFFALIAFNLLVGSRMYQMSRSSSVPTTHVRGA